MATTGIKSTLRWGICATGWISTKFTKDLLVDPLTRGVADVTHVVAAVSSRTEGKAASFVETCWKEAGVTSGKEDVKLYTDYQKLFEDSSLDCIYIGTPHSHHFANAHAALSAGKNVLCEKSLTVNAVQAQALADLARAKNVFFMEAVWTRFQPVSYKVQEVLKSGVIGEIRSVEANLSIDFKLATIDKGHRMVDPNLAGGALLDLGPYPWTWLALILLPETKASPTPLPVPKVVASMTKSSSGVDCSTVAVIQFPQADGRIVHGTMTCAMDVLTPPGRVAVVQGSKGYLEVEWATYRPIRFSYYSWQSEGDYAVEGSKPFKTETFEFEPRPGNIWGFGWEADEVARQIRDGKKESDRMPLRDTILMMQVFDKIREMGELVYPESIETLDL